jgi:hypothetical protein
MMTRRAKITAEECVKEEYEYKVKQKKIQEKM